MSSDRRGARTLRRAGGCVAALLLPLLSAESAAAQNTTGFEINRFDPSERGSDWFSAESLDLRGHNRWAVGAVGDWAYKPLVAYDENGDEVGALVQHQVFAHLGASAIFWDRVRLGVSLPVLVYQTGSDLRVGETDFAAPEGAGVGNLRLGGDVRLFGQYGDVATFALGAHVHLPTGQQDAFTSDGQARFVPRASLAGDIGIFTYALRTGVNFRFEGESFAGSAFGHEWTLGGAAGLRLIDKRLTVGPEIWTSTVIEDGSDGFFKEAATPLEGVFGAHFLATRSVKIGAAVGPGFTRGLGSPQIRTLASLEWFPEPKPEVEPSPADTDGDGIFDRDDACPTEPGPRDEDPGQHGCPRPTDTDGDGIFDDVDACIETPGIANEEDPEQHGCPPPDSDGDGIIDADDACVNEPGPKNEQEPEKHGCPLPLDSDGDGILDEEDACADQPGPKSSDPEKHGCPKAKIVDGQVKILERIEFDTSKATIREESTPVLEAVLKVLSEHPEITKLRIEGHTDNRGGEWLNKKLSRERAAAVQEWLVGKGIEPGRLQSDGVGPSRPIDSNETEEGRQNNRRVEFHIVESSTKSAGSEREN